MPITNSRGHSDPDAIGSVATALALLDLFEHVQTIRVVDVSRSLFVSPATAHRLLSTFENRGFLHQDHHHGSYAIGPRLARLSTAIAMKLDILTAVRPFMIELARELNETVSVAVLRGTEVLILEALDSDGQAAKNMPDRNALPTHATAAGKVFLSELARADLEQLYPSEILPRITSKTVTSREILLRELQHTRERGYGIHNEESRPHVIAYACPIRDHAGTTRAALIVPGPTGRFRHHSRLAVVSKMRSAASAAMGFSA